MPKRRGWPDGPWKPQEEAPGNPGFTTVVAPDGEIVCEVVDVRGGRSDVAIANLLAAAPDIYEALNDLVNRPTYGTLEELLQRAERALRIAETGVR